MTDLKVYTRLEVATESKDSNGNLILIDYDLVNLISIKKCKWG